MNFELTHYAMSRENRNVPRIAPVLAMIILIPCLLPAGAMRPGSLASADFRQLVDEYFDDYFRHNPTAVTAAGIHEYDTQLEDYSKPEIDRQRESLREFDAKFARLDPKQLDQDTACDLELMIANIRATLLELERVRSWERNPDRYSGGLTQSVFSVMSRKYAPAATRLEAAIARERQAAKVFQAARENLKDVPRIYTEVALEQLPGIIEFFRKDVPEAFADVENERLQDQFRSVNQAVIES